MELLCFLANCIVSFLPNICGPSLTLYYVSFTLTSSCRPTPCCLTAAATNGSWMTSISTSARSTCADSLISCSGGFLALTPYGPFFSYKCPFLKFTLASRYFKAATVMWYQHAWLRYAASHCHVYRWQLSHHFGYICVLSFYFLTCTLNANFFHFVATSFVSGGSDFRVSVLGFLILALTFRPSSEKKLFF